MQNNRPKIKILHIIESLTCGGAEKMLLTYLKHLNRERFDSSVFYLYKDGSLLPEVEKMGIKAYSGDMDGMAHPFSALSRISDMTKREGIDIIHTNLFGADIYGRIAGKVLNSKRVVTTLHNIAYESAGTFRNRFFFERRRLLDALTGRLFNDSFIAVSNSVKESAEKFLGFKNIKIIYNSVDVGVFKPLSDMEIETSRKAAGIREKSFHIVIVGRLDAYKGHAYLLEALAKKELRDRDFILSIAGSGAREQELRSRAERLGISGKVLFLGFRNDINNIVGCADLFVLPSVSEGFPMSLLEAMALKVPCVASRVGGIGEIVENRKTGLLVDPGSADSLANAVSELMDDQSARENIAINGHNRVINDFDVNRNVKLLENLYENCLN